ncbi:hypothetical protein GCM10014719_48690 [Planomonospora parontospora subsp. antibiotica]|nr:hypothetical protein GCM10014719_48690 [Planomonospora parontospora subsp. antibiotica]GII18274.1 hypothetical protein Ppa05_50000 [Planomonospora parontospora subsp. antibiotica]
MLVDPLASTDPGSGPMGVAPSDVITSAPSVWGAAGASSAAAVFPLAAPVALALGTLVSDPAQIWHAGDRYGGVAERVRSASTLVTEAVNGRADADRWTERGRDAFMAARVRPYQETLGQAAEMYDAMDAALKLTAVAYTSVGLSSAVIGAALVRHVASLLAAAVVPALNVQATYVANARMVEAGTAVRALIAGLAKANGPAAALLSGVAARLGVSRAVLAGLGTLGAGGLGGFVGARAVPAAGGAATPLEWPRRVEGDVEGDAVPGGFRAPTADQRAGMRSIRPDSIRALGEDLDAGPGRVLDAAYEDARGIEVGFPGFGVAGIHLFHAHGEMRDGAVRQLAAGRDVPGTWLPGLRTTADNWVFAERANTGGDGRTPRR